MTRFAPPYLHQCPACAGYFTRAVLTSLHYYDDMPEWSDGKSGQWWAGASGSVGRCPSCTGIVWLDDAMALMESPTEPRPIGPVARIWHRLTGDKRGRLREERNWLALPAEIKGTQSIVNLTTADDYIEALAAQPLGARDREIHLRRRLWWASNNHLRVIDGAIEQRPAVAADAALINAERLLELFEHDPKEQVARGELLRQLGRVDEAVAVLRAVKPDGYSEVTAVKIERLALAGIAELRDLNSVPSFSARGEKITGQRKASVVVW